MSNAMKTMLINAMLFYPSIILGGYLLLDKSMVLYVLYILILAITVIAGRYIICRSCRYYGKPCHSFGFSYLAKMFPQAENKPFNGKAALIETRIIGGCFSIPIITWILSWIGLVKSYTRTENIFMMIYIVLVVFMSILHKRTACDKCDIKECPLAK
jgi:hypothetical protein